VNLLLSITYFPNEEILKNRRNKDEESSPISQNDDGVDGEPLLGGIQDGD
jgi:hypothetical protein